MDIISLAGFINMMPLGIPMNGLRRKNDPIKNLCRYQKKN